MLTLLAKRVPMRCTGLAVLAFLVFSPAVRAQEESSSKPKEAKQRQAQSVGAATNQSDLAEAGESSSQPSSSKASTPEPVIRSIGRAGALGNDRGSLHWGPVGVRSAAINQYFDHVSLSDGSFNQWIKTTVLETNIVYDHRTRRSRLAIQYQPQLTVVDGRVLGNYSNQDLNLDTYYYLSHRWSMSINDTFRHYGNRYFYAGTSFDTDLSTGTVARNDFLQSPGQLISNSTTVSFTYQLSQRTVFSVAPDFTYAHTGGSTSVDPAQTFNAVSNSVYGFGGTMSVNHYLSARSSMGAFYSVNRSRFANNFSNTIYHTVGGQYARQLTSTIHFDAVLGYTRAFFGSGEHEEGLYADVNAYKRFKRSVVSLGYVRGQSNSDALLNSVSFITNRFLNRVDVAYSVELNRRVSLGASVGYLQEGGSEPGISGTYTSTYVSYRLLRSLSLFGQYAHKNQSGQAPQIASGHRDFFTLGLRWAPPSAEAY